MSDKLVIGVDYGTDSVRAILLNTSNGNELSSAVFEYPRWKEKLYCKPDANQFRQHPLDYIEGLIYVVNNCVKRANISIDLIKGIAIDTTGSTPIAVNKQGIPLSLLPEFAENPNAMFILWKDHTAIKEANEINNHAKKYKVNYLKYVGGIYSSEWYWAKLLHILRDDNQVKNACYAWVEHCDWLPFLITGGNSYENIKLSRCAAGHKGLWSEEFNGFPPDNFFFELDPILGDFVNRMPKETYTSDIAAGKLSEEWAEKLGLHTNVVVSVGAFDAHMGAVGGQIEPYYLSKVMGTSTCDILIAPEDEIGTNLIKGICGQVNGSVIPNLVGLEAGQSAFGDTYAWFKKLLLWPTENLILTSDRLSDNQKEELIKDISENLIKELSAKAAKLEISKKDEIALDWFNGRRTPDANQNLKGVIANLNLGSDAPRIFKALVEATCFGAKSIVNRFIEEGVEIKGIIGIGGVAQKSHYVMQTLSDILGMPIKIHPSEQTCAIGAGMFAAVAAGIFTSVEQAMQAMGKTFDKVYHPNFQVHEIYEYRYEQFKSLAYKMESFSNSAN